MVLINRYKSNLISRFFVLELHMFVLKSLKYIIVKTKGKISQVMEIFLHVLTWKNTFLDSPEYFSPIFVRHARIRFFATKSKAFLISIFWYLFRFFAPIFCQIESILWPSLWFLEEVQQWICAEKTLQYPVFIGVPRNKKIPPVSTSRFHQILGLTRA